MGFKDIDVWGFVSAGVKVVDSRGNRYVVGEQNEEGFRALLHTAGGDNLAFESLDPIDHSEFSEIF